MLTLIFKIIIITILTSLVAIICRHWDPSIKPVILTITAIGAIFVTFVTDKISEKLSDPLVKVSVSRGNDELLVHIESKRPVETLAIDLPVLGRITNIHDINSITDAKTTLKRVIGNQSQYSQNNVEFLIEYIKPGVPLEYKILFESMSRNIFITGTDRYKISYTWHHAGNIKTKTKWISFDKGKEVDKPNIEVKGFTIRNRALTPEEIKKLYEEGPKSHNIE